MNWVFVRSLGPLPGGNFAGASHTIIVIDWVAGVSAKEYSRRLRLVHEMLEVTTPWEFQERETIATIVSLVKTTLPLKKCARLNLGWSLSNGTIVLQGIGRRRHEQQLLGSSQNERL